MFLYPTKEQIIKIHDTILNISGGLYGILKEGYIESCCDFIQSDDYYPDFSDKLSYLMYSLTMNHCFADGNKRTALTIASYFIALNYDNTLAVLFMRDFENIVVQVADDMISKDTLTCCIYDFMRRDGISEGSLLQLYRELTLYGIQ